MLSTQMFSTCWKQGADPIEFAKEHKQFARAFESFPGDADSIYPGRREVLRINSAA